MPLPIIPGTVRVAVTGAMPSSQRWSNVWHFRYAGGASSPGDSDLNALEALFVRFYSGAAFGAGVAWLSRCLPTVTLTKISMVRLDGTSLGTDFPFNILGTGSGNSLPSECAPVVTLRSNQRGRSHRGRIYLPAPVAGSVDANGRLTNTIGTATTVQLQGLMTALGGPLVTPFWELGVASYLLNVFTPVTLPTMDLDIDVQRRRKN